MGVRLWRQGGGVELVTVVRGEGVGRRWLVGEDGLGLPVLEEVELLREPVGTPEFLALVEAMEGATVLTWLPGEGRGLLRAVLLEGGDFSFASEELTEPELVEVRWRVLRGLGVGEGIFVERVLGLSEG